MHFISPSEKDAVPFRVYLQYVILVFSIFPTGNTFLPAAVVQTDSELPVESSESTEAFFGRSESRRCRAVTREHRNSVVLTVVDGETRQPSPAVICAERGHRLSNGLLAPLLL